MIEDSAIQTTKTFYAAHCLPIPLSEALIKDALVTLTGGSIQSVAADVIPKADYVWEDCLLLPPLSNAHDHGRGLKSLAYGVPDQPVETWVSGTYTMPMVDPYLVAATAFARMARSGIGSVTHCHLTREPARLLEEALAARKAATDIGIRVAFVIPLADRWRLGLADDETILATMPQELARATRERLRPIAEINEQLEVARAILDLQNELFQVQLGPVTPERCTDNLLSQIAQLSHETGCRVHMHMLESKYQRQWADYHYPAGLMNHLDTLGLLSSRLTLAHGTWLSQDECELLAEREVLVSVNTSSNLRLRSGVAPVSIMRQERVEFALGLDALALDDDDDMLREMRLARLMHAGWGFDDGGVRREEMLDAVCRVGAKAAGVDGGSIAPGKVGDLLALSLTDRKQDTDLMLCDIPTLLHSRMTAADIRALIINGREVVLDGRIVGVDEEIIRKELTNQLLAEKNQLLHAQAHFGVHKAAMKHFYQSGGHCSDCL